MKTLLALVVALAVGCSGPAQAPKNDAPDALTAQTVAFVKSDVFDTDLRAYCTGVWIDSNKILTANHCTRGGPLGKSLDYVVKADVYEPQSIRIKLSPVPRHAVVTRRDEDHDLALLEALGDAPSHDVVTMCGDDPKPGEFAQQVGHSLGMWWSYSSGDVSGVRFLDTGDGSLIYVQTTAPTSAGNSGGGLFNSKRELIGVAHATATQGQNLNLFVHPVYVRTFLGLF